MHDFFVAFAFVLMVLAPAVSAMKVCSEGDNISA